MAVTCEAHVPSDLFPQPQRRLGGWPNTHLSSAKYVAGIASPNTAKIHMTLLLMMIAKISSSCGQKTRGHQWNSPLKTNTSNISLFYVFFRLMTCPVFCFLTRHRHIRVHQYVFVFLVKSL